MRLNFNFKRWILMDFIMVLEIKKEANKINLKIEMKSYLTCCNSSDFIEQRIENLRTTLNAQKRRLFASLGFVLILKSWELSLTRKYYKEKSLICLKNFRISLEAETMTNRSLAKKASTRVCTGTIPVALLKSKFQQSSNVTLNASLLLQLEQTDCFFSFQVKMTNWVALSLKRTTSGLD